MIDIYQVIKQFLSWLVDLTIELHCWVLTDADAEQRCGEISDFIYADSR